MWLERRSARQILRPQLKAPLSPHDTHARKSQRLPAALSTGHSSTGRRGGRPEFEHSAKQMGAVRITRRSDVVLRSGSERPDVATWSCLSEPSCTCSGSGVLRRCAARGCSSYRTVVISGLRWSGHLLGGLLGRARQLGRRKAGQSGGRGHFANAFCWLLAPAGWMSADKFIPVCRPPQHPSPRPKRRRPRAIHPRGRSPARARPQAGLPAQRRGRSRPLLRMAAASGPEAPDGGCAGGHFGP